MTVYVDHVQRRNQILESSFELFAEEGFGGVTFQKIANRCGIARTLIYRYFKDKEEIFLFAVKQGTDNISKIVRKVMDRQDLTPLEKLRRVLHLIVKLLQDNRLFLAVICDFLAIQKQTGGNVRRKVRRYTYGMKFFMVRLLRESMEAGLLRVVDADKVASHLFALLEAFVLNLTIVDRPDSREYLALIDHYLQGQGFS